MKKAILTLVLAAVSGGAWAQQWVRVSVGESGTVLYVDPSTIRKDGNLRRFWSLYDFLKPDKHGDLSSRGVEEIDCKEERRRDLQEDWFRGPMGSGERSGGSNRPTEWRYVAPGSTGAAIMKFVCSP